MARTWKKSGWISSQTCLFTTKKITSQTSSSSVSTTQPLASWLARHSKIYHWYSFKRTGREGFQLHPTKYLSYSSSQPCHGLAYIYLLLPIVSLTNSLLAIWKTIVRVVILDIPDSNRGQHCPESRDYFAQFSLSLITKFYIEPLCRNSRSWWSRLIYSADNPTTLTDYYASHHGDHRRWVQPPAISLRLPPCL